MDYSAILNIAIEVAKKRSQSGFLSNPDDTVCVLCTNTGNIYTQINSIEIKNGLTNRVHAEINAINNMKANGESIVSAITVYNSYTLVPILPCNNCINYILSLNPQNANCQIILPDRAIRIIEVNFFVSNNTPPPVVPTTNVCQSNSYLRYTPNINNISSAKPNNLFSQSVSYYQTAEQNKNANIEQDSANINSVQVERQMTSSLYTPDTTKTSKGDYLNNKISNLLIDDDDEDFDDSVKKKKKRFGGLFG